jgi:hypothetical protein
MVFALAGDSTTTTSVIVTGMPLAGFRPGPARRGCREGSGYAPPAPARRAWARADGAGRWHRRNTSSTATGVEPIRSSRSGRRRDPLRGPRHGPLERPAGSAPSAAGRLPAGAEEGEGMGAFRAGCRGCRRRARRNARPMAQQVVRSRQRGVQRRSAHGVNLPPQLVPEPGGDQGAGLQRGFDDRHAEREARDDPVPLGEVAGEGPPCRAGSPTSERALGRDALLQGPVFGGIGHVEPAREDPDRPPRPGQPRPYAPPRPPRAPAPT